MAESALKIIKGPDEIWAQLRTEVRQQLDNEPALEKFLGPTVLEHGRFQDALSAILALRMKNDVLDRSTIRQYIVDSHLGDPAIVDAAKWDLHAFCQRDPACNRYSIPFLYYKGYQGLQLYRTGHWLWNNGHTELALYLQSRVSEVFDMDIHPAAKIGKGILIDHATSIVIGETAVVGDNVSMLHEVTLGGTGKDSGDRHPKVNSGVLIGAGAKILGNVRIGTNSKIGAGSVVLDDVEDHSTVAGIPAVPVGDCSGGTPALEMDHTLESDPVRES